MDVTKSNFNEVLPFIKETISDCDFIAIDTELTGLYGEHSTEHAFDSMEERYLKIRELCSKFLIIQFGVSAFKYHPIDKKYTHIDFNFYIFPNPHIRQAPDQRFLCQTSSLHYLAAQNFNFNKVIYEGIPYLRHDQEEELKKYTSNKYRVQKNAICTPKKDALIPDANGQREIHIPDEHKEFIDEIHKEVDSFISNESESIKKLDPCSALQRKLIYETVKQKYKTGIEMETLVNNNKERYIVISKASDDDKLQKLGLKETCDMDDIETAIGFRKVVELISKSRKLVLGHHMYLDMIHTINQFFYPLPKSLQEYKDMLHLIFPMLLDVKHLASEQLRQFLEGTTVGEIFKCIQGKAFNLPQIELGEVGKGYDMSDTKYHEAGFDAFVTGVNFIALARKLASMESKNSEHIDCHSEVLAPHLNKFFIYRHYDTPFLNLSGPDLNPDRSNVFYVSFPEEWKTVDLVELFLPYGEIYVHWLNDVSALVALKKPANTINAKSALLNKSSKMYHVRTYADFQKELQQHSSKEEVLLKKPIHPISNSPSTSKKKFEMHNRLSMESIVEADENEAEEAPGKPPSKKLKKSYDDPESGEVTSTFEEESTW